MEKYTIRHNPRCSKSRQTLNLLEDRGLNFEIRQYLETPPNPDEIENVLEKLKMRPTDLMRKKEKPYQELGIPSMAKKDQIVAMTKNPYSSNDQ